MRRSICLLLILWSILNLVGCTSKYNPWHPTGEIAAIDIVKMEGNDVKALKNAEVLAHIEEEAVQQFMDELGALTMHYYSPPPQILSGTAIRIQYADGNFEEVNACCTGYFSADPQTRVHFVDWGFRQEEFDSFLSRYLQVDDS